MICALFASVTFVIAVLTLIGWACDVPILRGVIGGSVAMNPSSALGFILSAAAVCLLRREAPAPLLKRTGRTLAAIVATFGAIRLGCYATGIEPGFDQLLFQDALADNLMAPNTAGFFLLTGVSLLSRDAAAWFQMAQSLTLATLASAFLAIVGYAFGGGILYAIPSHIPMALNTAFAFLALALAIMESRPRRGVVGVLFSDEAGGEMAKRLIPAGIVVPLLLGGMKLYGESAGLFDAEFGGALLVSTTVMVFMAVIWCTARVLNQSDAQRRHASVQLRTLSAFQQAILDSADYSIIATDLNGIITVFNRGAERMLGYRGVDVVGKAAPEIIHDKSEIAARAQQLSDALGRTIAPGFEVVVAKLGSGRCEEHEWTYVCSDGARLPVSLALTAIRSEGGEVVGYVGIAKDIAARQIAENALRESDLRFRQLADNIEEIFWMTSADGREMIYISPAYEKIWERTCDSLYARPADWIEAIHAEDRERVVRAFFKLGPVGEFDEEYRVVSPAGKIRWVHARGAVIRNAAGEVHRLAGVAQNVTERRRYEENLREAKRHADEANRTKSQFLAAMSHELRTPLHGVIGMIDLLGDTRLDDHQSRFVEACRASARSLLGLINDVLDLSKIESGKLVLECHEFEPDQVVEDAVRLLAMRAQEKGLELVCSIDESVCRTVRGDSMRVRQVLVNLLGNAVKFTPSGSIVMQAKLHSTDGLTAVVRFAISDTGIGIPPERVDHLFTPFTQADASTTRRFGGSGLGLAICKTLVEAMGGQIGVDSRESVGSSFWFTTQFEDVRERSTVIPHELRCLRALVAVDKPVLRGALQQQLSAFGITAESTSSGQETLDRLIKAAPSQPFDLVLADQYLIDMEGSTLAGAIRANPLLRATRTFVLTAFNDTTNDFPAGDCRLHKPICRSELLNSIIACFCQSSPVSQASATRETRAPVCVSAYSGKARILLAEDNHINQMFAREVLRQAGLDCDCATNGAQAVEAVQCERYDLILMDCHMPDMDGFEASRRIRQMERDGNIGGRVSIVALTANAVKGDHDRCLEVGMDDYITKPFEAAELISAIDNALSRTAGIRTNSAINTRCDMVPNCLPPIDAPALMARCLGNAAFAESLLHELQNTGMECVEQIARLAEAGDASAAAETAHALKGAAGIIAAEGLRCLAERIEAAGNEKDLEDIVRLVEPLREEMQRCARFVPTFFGQAGMPTSDK